MSANPLQVSRRAFVGGLVIAIALPGCKPARESSRELKTVEANAWLRIGTDDSITFLCDRSEMGQGVFTSLPMLIAEELGVNLARIKVEFAPPGDQFHNNLLGGQITGGSTTEEGGGLRNQGATVTLLDCVLVGNTADYGAAFFNDGGLVSLTNTPSTGNTVIDAAMPGK